MIFTFFKLAAVTISLSHSLLYLERMKGGDYVLRAMNRTLALLMLFLILCN